VTKVGPCPTMLVSPLSRGRIAKPFELKSTSTTLKGLQDRSTQAELRFYFINGERQERAFILELGDPTVSLFDEQINQGLTQYFHVQANARMPYWDNRASLFCLNVSVDTIQTHNMTNAIHLAAKAGARYSLKHPHAQQCRLLRSLAGNHGFI